MTRRHGPHERALAVLNAALDAALDQRVQLHRDREEGTLEVAGYLAGLEAVRNIEDALEPLRDRQGHLESRAYETHRQEAA